MTSMLLAAGTGQPLPSTERCKAILAILHAHRENVTEGYLML